MSNWNDYDFKAEFASLENDRMAMSQLLTNSFGEDAEYAKEQLAINRAKRKKIIEFLDSNLSYGEFNWRIN